MIRLGPDAPAEPLMITVPHAGRDYPLAMTQLCRLPIANLRILEDRYADRLVDTAVQDGFAALVATAPRAWIDLNRAESEYDPALVKAPHGMRAQASRKVSGGLGVIPARIGNGGAIWRAPIMAEDFLARLEAAHRPWHAAIEAALDEMAAAFGLAVLVDLHSMPPLRERVGETRADVVIGDLYGKSAQNWLGSTAAAVARGYGLRPALNAPYAGGYGVARHGRPRHGIHALQIEIDRSLYLDRERDLTGPGLSAIQGFVAALARALADEAAARAMPLAAE
jgi:N-formylglutamate amidohydrolase